MNETTVTEIKPKSVYIQVTFEDGSSDRYQITNPAAISLIQFVAEHANQ